MLKLKKNQYLKSENIEMFIENVAKCNSIEISAYHLSQKIWEQKLTSENIPYKLVLPASNWISKKENAKGIKLIVKERLPDNTIKGEQRIIFDIVNTIYDTPRYGFVSDFSDDFDVSKTVNNLKSLHITLVQFYDWMYRHHELVSENPHYVDAMGKKISNLKVKEMIQNFQANGISSFGYAAIYGSQPEYFEKHQDELLYTIENVPIKFLPQIAFMDINKESNWQKHIIQEFIKTLEYGFDGLHLDTYGFPKEARNFENKLRNLRTDIPDFIDSLREEMTSDNLSKGLIFNNVNSWPIDTVATTSVDVNYIEVWSPHDEFYDLYLLLQKAKTLTPNKQTILSAYMHPFVDLNQESSEKEIKSAELSTLLTMATIFSNGGFHLALGEANKILTQAYYSDNTALSDKFLKILYKYYDFFVQNESLMIDYSIYDDTNTSIDGINDEIIIKNYDYSAKPKLNHLWSVVKKKENNTILELINFNGSEHLNWNKKNFGEIKALYNVEVQLNCIGKKVKRVTYASPEQDWLDAEIEEIAQDNGKLCIFKIEKINIWTTVYIEFD